MLCRLREAGIQPILMNLPPLLPQWFFDWWCRDLDQAAVRTWLGDLSNIYAHQERYSRAVESLAREEAVPLVDVRGGVFGSRPSGDAAVRGRYPPQFRRTGPDRGRRSGNLPAVGSCCRRRNKEVAGQNEAKKRSGRRDLFTSPVLYGKKVGKGDAAGLWRFTSGPASPHRRRGRSRRAPGSRP